MAIRPVFRSGFWDEKIILSENVEFEWFPGFSTSQKQKSINALHKNFLKNNINNRILEISSKSPIKLGIELSAFNLMIETQKKQYFSVETAFQASKVFENGGPFIDLYKKSSKEAKKDNRIKNSGKLLYFQFFNRQWGLEPKTFFYDWLYINALAKNKKLSAEVIKFDSFTDIEFNPKKSVNCQAKSAAIYVSLYKTNKLDKALSSRDNFKEVVYGVTTNKASNKTLSEEYKQLYFFN